MLRARSRLQQLVSQHQRGQCRAVESTACTLGCAQQICTGTASAFNTNNAAEVEDIINLRPGIAVVAAGPGTGKTRIIAARIAKLLETRIHRHRESDSFRCGRILALTFTQAAALNLAHRVDTTVAIDSHSDGPAYDVATFHSFAHSVVQVCQPHSSQNAH
eukprot:SAG31_NODE_284_length_18497_cov_11.811773_4_plen_161_part_00